MTLGDSSEAARPRPSVGAGLGPLVATERRRTTAPPRSHGRLPPLLARSLPAVSDVLPALSPDLPAEAQSAARHSEPDLEHLEPLPSARPTDPPESPPPSASLAESDGPQDWEVAEGLGQSRLTAPYEPEPTAAPFTDAHATAETDADVTPEADADDWDVRPDPGWHDEFPTSTLGEAEPEDVAPLLSAPGPESAVDRTPAAPDAFSQEWATAESITVLRSDPERITEVAERLERIARTLRDHGSAAPLVQKGMDPLGALITGYLLGFFEGSGKERPPPSG